MKFLSLVILAAATAVCAAPAKPEPQITCDAICSDDYQPVNCTDGVVHSNWCEYETCREPRYDT
ncbi:hypothetical protein ISF_09049 [Cordyceps fumosorosea ARSEF 2679]|uniref:Kazal-like domain-containing protein n=1 Tax=Cordyceps fumosorosea (strain ARSEF 2679) TaxID=1081104 RepID=A0A162I6W0_CORFA|nr:hypothetical protein ISF_09049 [Cordyceps fumosorosea ARSEF 2679]OAA53095.1 hypothetical protein ISF_09049 [Cordyceps fumosorosea ARSEF 2679]